MKQIQIKDIYAGKPDAKDEIHFDGFEEFIKTYVVADHFDIDSLINGDKCFITGFKGTGKTALLFYLDAKIRSSDESSCSSFVFFKEDFTDAQRNELHALSHRITSTISVDSNALIASDDFEHIWRWLLFKRIIADNDQNSRNLFMDDEAWQAFENIMKRIHDPKNANKMRIPSTIRLAIPFRDNNTQTEVGPEFEIDLAQPKNDELAQFINIIDSAEEAFMHVIRTDIPYHIFVDELEAYYGDETLFKRDLGLIRDLVFTVKRFNTMFKAIGFKETKIICSVRSEILNAISRFIVTKEINKVTAGFSVPLVWNYTNSNSYAHPIVQILLKRIAVCSEAQDKSMLEIYKLWFPEKIHEIEPASYILNNSWCKPRDIVRFIISAHNSLQRTNTAFTLAVFSSLSKEYSEESLVEIKEELRALYDPEQIDTIISCFTGYKTSFSFNELSERIKKYYPGTVLQSKLTIILNDLYRLGFLGNYFPATKSYHWQHKGDSQLILNDDWRLFIHYALHSALSLRTKNDRKINQSVGLQPGDTSKICINQIRWTFALGSFEKYGTKYTGRIHVSEFRKLGYGYIDNLGDVISVGDTFDIIVKKKRNNSTEWEVMINLP